MNRRSRSTLLLGLPLFGFLGVALPQSGQDEANGALERVRPGTSLFADEPTDSFDASAWTARLSDADLVARMKSFEELVELAWTDRAARQALEDLAGGSSTLELAWTAKLALRELDRPVHRLLGGNRVNRILAPFGPNFDLLSPSELQALLPSELFDPRGPAPDASQQRKSVRVEQRDGGWHIEVTEQKDGDTQTREFTGATLEEILEQNPELKDEIGVQDFGAPRALRFHLGGPGSAHVQELLRELEGLQGFRMFQPFQLDGHLDGRGGELEIFTPPQSPSQPVRTDVFGVYVTPLSRARAAELGIPAESGLAVRSALPGTMAHILGVAAGDVLLELNGKSLATAEDLTAVVRARQPEEGLTLVWIDTGGEKRSKTWTPNTAAPQRSGARDF